MTSALAPLVTETAALRQTQAPLLARMLYREGGMRFTNRPTDRGGPTLAGLTLGALREVWPQATVEDLRRLTQEEVEAVHAWQRVRPFAGWVPAEALEAIVDSATHHGVAGTIPLLQRALKVAPDGIVGPVTQAAAQWMAPRTLRLRLLAERFRLVGRLVTSDWQRVRALPPIQQAAALARMQAANAAGWNNRFSDLLEEDA